MATIEVKRMDSQGGGSQFITIESNKTYTPAMRSDFQYLDVAVTGPGEGNGTWAIELAPGDTTQVKNGTEAIDKGTLVPDGGDAQVVQVALWSDSWAEAVEDALANGTSQLSLTSYAISDAQKTIAEDCSKTQQAAGKALEEEYQKIQSACDDSPGCVDFRLPWGGSVTLAESKTEGYDAKASADALAIANISEGGEPCWRPGLRTLSEFSSISFSGE